ncbi:hypothetical protein E2C01_065887 [Portunus trituberculatus]|uniref:Uncharacterized protein n=1 Tax=Portunus trituberculatus TaxID=210409 RepID=A0A5B7HT26_PORTR|nr:hypothetical protein [Portunus trituberculatus]
MGWVGRFGKGTLEHIGKQAPPSEGSALLKGGCDGTGGAVAETAGDVLQQPGSRFEGCQCGGHVSVWSLVGGDCIMDRVLLKGGLKVAVVVPDCEYGGLGLCDVDRREVMDAAALGACQDFFEAVDLIARVAEGPVFFGGLLTAWHWVGGEPSVKAAA